MVIRIQKMFRLLLIIFTILGLNACNAKDTQGSRSDKSETDDSAGIGEDNFERGQAPTPITGSQMVNTENTRVRCDYITVTVNTYEVLCSLAIVQPNGTELLALGAENGIDIYWQKAILLYGAAADAVLTISGDNMRGSYLVTKESPMVKLQFDVKIQSKKKSVTESTLVTLPYSVEVVAGFIPTMGKYKGLDENKGFELGSEKPKHFGLQRKPFPIRNLFMTSNKMCSSSLGVFMGKGKNIYKVKDETALHYAGSESYDPNSELSHRLRVTLSDSSIITCNEKGVVVVDPDKSRVLLLKDSGAVQLVHRNFIFDPTSSISANNDFLFFVDGFYIKKMSLKDGSISIAVGNGEEGYTADGTNAESAAISPRYLAMDFQGHLYFYEQDSKVRRIDQNNKLITLAENVNGKFAISPESEIYYGQSSNSQIYRIDKLSGIHHPLLVEEDFENIYVLCFDHEGALYFSKRNPSLFSLKGIFKFTAKGRIVRVFSSIMFTDFELQAKDASLSGLTGLALDSQSNIFSTAIFNKLMQIDLQGNIRQIPKITGTTYNSISYGLNEKLYTITGNSVFELVNDQLVLVADLSSFNIEWGSVPEGDHDPYEPYVFSSFDQQGKMYLALRDKSQILLFDGSQISVIAGAENGSLDDNIDATTAALNTPQGFSITPDGNLFVSDTNNNLIRVILPPDQNDIRKIKTIIGGGNITGDGYADEIELIKPASLAAASDGTLYFIERGRKRVRQAMWKTDSSGSKRLYVTTLFGDEPNIDCGSGVIKGESQANEIDTDIKKSLAILCRGEPKHIAVSDTCGNEDGTVKIAFTQDFSPVAHLWFAKYGNIIQIERPCE